MATKIKNRAKGLLHGVSAEKLQALRLVYDGSQLLNRGDQAGAERAWRRAVRVDPQCVPGWTYLTDFLAVSKRADEASGCLERLISVTERTALNLWTLADKCCFQKRYELGRTLLRDALGMNPSGETLDEIRILLVKIDFTEQHWIAAVEGATRILEADPKHMEALKVRQASYFNLGWAQEDVDDCRRLLELKPDADRHSRLVFKINYLAETTPEIVYEEAKRWNELYAAPLAGEIRPHTNTREPERRLKIGYVSPDLRRHPIMKLLPAVFENHDGGNLEVFAYSINTKQDAETVYVQNTVKNFIDLPNSRQKIAERVRADEIDILVDLAGHTMDGEAYLAFAMKPAPVQVSWLGVLQTTGLTTMDFFIGDQHMPHPGTEHLFSERVYRLNRPTGCYRPAADPGLAPSPYFTNGYITFGCFNDPKKITRNVVKVWSVILHLNPTSKMLFKYTYLGYENGQRRLRMWFAEDGIMDDRLLFVGGSPPEEYMDAYNSVDIALDPFPYNGGTTTLDAIYMGVPVVSVASRLAVGCSGAGLLPQVGLPVANTYEQYVVLASNFAKTIPTTPLIRQQISEAMKKSAFMDEPGLVRELEQAYREMWREWCSSQEHVGLIQ